VKKALLYLVLVWTLVLGFWGLAGTALAATSAVEGYAWSSNVGWISFNCKNSGTCGTSNYGVSLDRGTGNLSGYAWNSSVGWISFQASDVASCPSAPCAPKIIDGKLTGWAKVISGKTSEGWNGWMHLAGSTYGVSFDGTRFTGFSWSDDVLGWVRWDPAKGPGVFSISDVTLTTGISGGKADSDVRIESEICDRTTCTLTFEFGSNVDLVATPGVGSVFVRWEGANAGECAVITSRLCSGIILSADKEIRALFDISSTKESPPVAACDDCLDNDGDGKIDWLEDSGCSDNPADTNETNAILTVTVVNVGPGTKGKVISSPTAIDCGITCTHEYTSDESVKLTAVPENAKTVFDHWSGACSGTGPTCSLIMNASRSATAHFRSATGISCPADGPGKCPVCNDGVDNDGDGKIDFPSDMGCSSLDDDDEVNSGACPAGGPGVCPECNDGIDNDGDDLVDFPDDLECESYADDNESDTGPNCPADGPGICPQCNDGIDNDGDGKIDYPKDVLGCFNRLDDNEKDPVIAGHCPEDGPGECPRCNDGIDNDGDGKIDWNGWDADKDKAKIKEIPRDPNCQGEPNKDSEAGSIDIIEK